MFQRPLYRVSGSSRRYRRRISFTPTQRYGFFDFATSSGTGAAKVERNREKNKIEPRAVLRAVPATIRIVIFDDGWFLLDGIGPGATAGHRGTEEYVDNEHDEEQNAKNHGQPEQP